AIGTGDSVRFQGTAAAAVRDASPEAKKGNHFSETKNASGVDYVTFNGEHGETCFGILLNGPRSGGSSGYKWYLRATRCDAKHRKVTETDIAQFVLETGFAG